MLDRICLGVDPGSLPARPAAARSVINPALVLSLQPLVLARDWRAVEAGRPSAPRLLRRSAPSAWRHAPAQDDGDEDENKEKGE